MEIEEAVKILKLYQEWRLGANIDMPHTPRQITNALDTLLDNVVDQGNIING